MGNVPRLIKKAYYRMHKKGRLEKRLMQKEVQQIREKRGA
jgi:hypothetical protein